MTALAMAAAALGIAIVGSYWAFTLLEVAALRPLVQPPLRQLGLTLALGAAWFSLGMTLVALQAAGQLSGAQLNLAALGPPATAAALVTSCAAYAWRRQWLWPRPATLLRPVELAAAALAEEDLVAVLDDGAAAPLGWLERHRTARWGDVVLVHCGLSLATSALAAPTGRALAAWLPHRTGFWIGGAGQRWDGVDGHAEGGAGDLPRRPLAVMPLVAWRQRWPQGQLLGDGASRGVQRQRAALTRSAVGVADGARLGVVEGNAWRPLNLDAAAGHGEKTAAAPYYLARWAAVARGLDGAA